MLLRSQVNKGPILWSFRVRYLSIKANRNLPIEHSERKLSNCFTILEPHQASPLAKTPLRAQQLAQHFSPNYSSQQKPEMSSSSTYTTRKIGAPNTLEHRIYIERDGVVVSPFHDIPLYANDQQTVLNMVVEIPRWTNAKMEVPTHRHSNLVNIY